MLRCYLLIKLLRQRKQYQKFIRNIYIYIETDINYWMIFTTCYIQRDNILVKIRQVCQEIEISQIIRKMITHNIIKIRSRKITRDSQLFLENKRETKAPSLCLSVSIHQCVWSTHARIYETRERDFSTSGRGVATRKLTTFEDVWSDI